MFYEKEKLYTKNEDDCISLIEDNKIIFGAYICIYKPNTYGMNNKKNFFFFFCYYKNY